MKFSVFIAAALASSVAMADGRFHGVDQDGGACYLDLEDVPTAPTGVIETGAVQIAVGGYRLTGLYLRKNSDTNYSVKDELLIDNGDGHYSRVIGAPITVAGLGILESTIHLELGQDKSVAAIRLKGKGLWAWWRKSFTCTLSQYQ